MDYKVALLMSVVIAVVAATGYPSYPAPQPKGWSDWSDWSACSADCGGGKQFRTRTCNAPTYLAKFLCRGSSKEYQSCNTHPCKVNGGWGPFGDWGACSAECGGGYQTRERMCDNPPPANGGDDCDGSPTERRSCNSHPCKVNGGWGPFGDWGACSAECGGGYQTRERMCDNPPPANGGDDCDGSPTERRSCNSHPCDVDGGWSDWSDWSSCSSTCRGGEQTKTRTCTEPRPQGNGRDCKGPSTKTRSCNRHVPCKKHNPY